MIDAPFDFENEPRHFTEQNDIGTCCATPTTTRAFVQQGDIGIIGTAMSADIATFFGAVAVHFKGSGTGFGEQAVDVLGDDGDLAMCPIALQTCERVMGGVWLIVLLHMLTSHGIFEVKHFLWLFPPALDMRDHHRIVLCPQSIGVTKGGNATLGRKAGARADYDIHGLFSRDFILSPMIDDGLHQGQFALDD